VRIELCHTLTSAGGKQQRLLELYDLVILLRIDDFNTYQLPISFLDLDLARAADQMVEPSRATSTKSSFGS